MWRDRIGPSKPDRRPAEFVQMRGRHVQLAKGAKVGSQIVDIFTNRMFGRLGAASAAVPVAPGEAAVAKATVSSKGPAGIIAACY